MIHLIYVSSATKEMTESDLLELLKKARERNAEKNITGMLLYANQNFIQILEGDSDDVLDIYHRILNDTRNTGNIIIQKKAIADRSFPDWTMGFKHISNAEIEATDGFSAFFQNKGNFEHLKQQSQGVVNMLYSFNSNM